MTETSATTLPSSSARELRLAAAASTIGSVIEWYDYNIFALSAALVFPTVFFPQSTPLVGVLQSFAAFAAAFILRPVGALIFGHFGDRYGRKTILIITLMTMGIATVAIGLLPSAGQIGVWAPFLLFIFRIVQGVALGGEWGGGVLIVVEHADHRRRGLWGSLPQIGSPAANLCATGMMAFALLISGKEFLVWGWRIPFLASIILLAVGLFIRMRVSESPVFNELKQTESTFKNPIKEMFKRDTKRLLLTMGSRIGVDVGYYTFAVYSLSYMSGSLGLPKQLGLTALFIAAAIEIVTIPIFGSLSDRIGRRRMFMWGLIALAVWAIAFFPLVHLGSYWSVILAFAVAFGIGHGTTWSVMGAFYPELFPTRMRYTGASFSFQMAGVFGGALAPFIATLLVASSLGIAGVSVYVIAACALSFFCVFALPETFKHSIRDVKVSDPVLPVEENN